MRRIFIELLNKVGLTLREDPQRLFVDMDFRFKPVYNKTKKYTMTSTERMFSLYQAIEYISKNNIPGEIVECGVWRGGSAMVCAYALQKLRDTKRRIFLYDTYRGMTEPDNRDRTVLGNTSAHDIWEKSQQENGNAWCYASIEDVQKNLFRTKYPKRKLAFIEGKVEETIPKIMPKHIALLRLDTDWYGSTYHELTYLYPRLVPGGVLVIDDYGHWKGVRRAVDDYFRKHKISILLNRVDYAGRTAIKPAG